ncbi:MAG: hypothetical protein LBI56_02775 [Puniceicoccales bacterium]|nr:hypothetical protein [Puniceicoccales bacterium]
MEQANFIVNCGQASAGDVEKLVNAMRCEAYSKFREFLHAKIKFPRAQKAFD